MRQNNEEYELGTVEVIVNKVEKTLTKVIFSDYLGTIEYTLTYGEGAFCFSEVFTYYMQTLKQ